MKTRFKFLGLGIAVCLFISCSQDDDDFKRATTVKVVNLIKEVDHIIVKVGDGPIDYAITESKIAFEGFKNFSFLENVEKGLEVVTENDTLFPIYTKVLNLKGVNSLYLSGVLGEEDALLVEDNVKQYTDSVVGIRFINLSKELSGPIDINILGDATTLVTGLDYQEASDYLKFPAQKADGSYVFEFRDTSGNISTTYFTVDPLHNNKVFAKKNITLAITEIKIETFLGPIDRYKISRVNHY